MIFEQIIQVMNKSQNKPTAIKVNPSWYEKQIQQSFVLRKEGENPLESFGIPVEFDLNINTFQFQYQKEE